MLRERQLADLVADVSLMALLGLFAISFQDNAVSILT